ncbi:MAG: EAL domain-containing protein [Edaphobacter sp.]
MRGLIKDELSARFQPIYDVDSRIVFALEGLIRGPAGSVVEDPDKLFEAAERNEMTVGLDQAAYKAVLSAFNALSWPGKLFLNLLPGTLLGTDRLPVQFRRAIGDAGLHPSQIVLELNERDPIPDAAAMLNAIDPFLDEGMLLSLDDVGSGFSNMRLICELQPNFLKIDRFFMAGLSQSAAKQSAVRHLIRLALDMGAQVIAEGVEQEQDALLAKELGISLMQGFLFGRPTANPGLLKLPPSTFGRSSGRSPQPLRLPDTRP